MFSSSRILLLVVASVALASCGSDSPNPVATEGLPAPAADSGGLSEISGSVEAIGGSSVTVSGRVFMVTQETQLLRQGAGISLADLRVGDSVVVKAKTNVRGELVASEIRVRVDAPQEVKFTGNADKVTPPDLVVAGRVVHTDSATQYTGLGNPGDIVDVRPGYLVTVTGTQSDDGSVSASKIRIESKG